MYKHVIFDLFGTIVKPIPEDPYIKQMSLIKTTKSSFDKNLLHPLVYPGSFLSWLSELNVSNVDIHVPTTHDVVLYGDVLKSFSYLRSRNIGFSFMSNIGRLYADLIMAQSWSSLAEHIFFSCDYQLTKPDPRFYQCAVDALHLDASEIVFLGDSLKNDVDGPKKAGMASYLVREQTDLFNQLKDIYET